MNFRGNALHGGIADGLSNCTGLMYIFLDKNHLTGEIPFWLGGFPKLVALLLSKNNLTETIPLSLGNLTSLQALYLDNNQLEGSIPDELGRLNNLQWLALFANHLSGTVPEPVFNLSSVFAFGVDQNYLHGTLPPNWGNNQPNLAYIFLTLNHFMGNVPASLANATMLYNLDISFNNFTGKMPPEIGTLCPSIFSFDSNQIEASSLEGWEFITLLTNCSWLRVLTFRNNMRAGNLPVSVANLSANLQVFYAGFNQIQGNIPPGIGNLVSLQKLFLSHNQFVGTLPGTIGRLKMMRALGVDGNLLSGTIPPSIGNPTLLQIITLDDNNFEGPLPFSIMNLQQLSIVTLSHGNSFSGSLPTSISKMLGLVVVNLSNNFLSGEIPQEFGRTKGLQELYLGHNNLSGQIPGTFQNMTGLYLLDISFNHLSGQVPVHGVFVNPSRFLFRGNDGLCGGTQELHLPVCPVSEKHSSTKKRVILIITISIGSFLVLYWDDKYRKVSYAELAQGTDGFASTNLVGRGRYGSVYKGRLSLKNAETVVAVKVFDLQQSGSSKSFEAECVALSKIRHRNLISVITCCCSSDSRQNDFKAIVFEFMPNQSLDKWLHDANPCSDASRPIPGLTLIQRLNIAVDVAEALDYLHNDCEPPIVHCDLKPSNVLLNEDFVACVGDFGLAKILYDSEAEQVINSKSFTGIRGTIGYVAPGNSKYIGHPSSNNDTRLVAPPPRPGRKLQTKRL
ncbi:hypothetical protein HU200_033537 [Digitaria exilis]|uniref:Protein kinase domain-containing protein n=1 Tax=Digitaria exilis TaxID=1010633 RepID=A0A835BJ39_9POAL|nr:hypothetical protein HU200_033537 [Digitaria exilis]